MPVCPNCGNQAAETAVFCDQCGTKLASAETPAPAPPVAETPAGGVPEGIIICPACGAENVPGEVFCDACGEPLEAPEPAPVEAIIETEPEPVVEAEPVIEAEPEPVYEAETVVEAEVVTETVPPDEDQALEDTITETIIEEEIVPEPAPEAKELFCPACGAAIRADDTFCGNCGASLSEPAADLVKEVPIIEQVEVEEEAPEPVQEEEPVEIIVEDVVEPETSAAPAPDSGVPKEPPAPEMPATQEPMVEEVEETVVEQVAEEPADVEPRCSVCGATVLPEQRFCASCGAALQPAAEVEAAPASPIEPLVTSVSTGPYLTIVESGAQVPLVDQPELLVGRVDDVSGIYPDIDLTPHGGEEGGVSRRHARLLQEEKEWSIMDLDSTNGTFVNEVELEPKVRTALQDGDKISFGDIEVIFNTA